MQKEYCMGPWGLYWDESTQTRKPVRIHLECGIKGCWEEGEPLVPAKGLGIRAEPGPC